LSDTFDALNRPRDWHEIRAQLTEAAAKTPADGTALLTLARDLLLLAKRRDATVLLAIDQAEELFGFSAPDVTERFLRLLRAALEASDRQLMTLATMRSDFLSEFQLYPVLHDPACERDFTYEPVTVESMPLRSIQAVIEGPARLAGLRLEAGLAEAMVRDTGTRDALPLLAFSLRRLYESCSADGFLEIREYDELGRLDGAIHQEADRVFKAAKPSTEELAELRAAFVPTMVRINADGAYSRRHAYRDEMPRRAGPLLNRFVEARLLVTERDQDGRKTIEVAHEALLRTWPQLSAWLTEDQERLRLLESIRRAAQEWDGSGRRDDLLIHRDGRLEEAKALVREPRFGLPEGSVENVYLGACLAAQHARDRARRQRIRTTIGALVAGLFILGGIALWAFIERNAAQRAEAMAEARALEAKTAQAEAESERNRAISRLLAAAALTHLDEKLALTLLLAVEASRIAPTLEAISALWKGLEHNRRLATFLHGELVGIQRVAFSRDGEILAAAGNNHSIHLWNVGSGQPVGQPLRGHKSYVMSVAFSPGKTLASGSADKTVVLWNTTGSQPIPRPLETLPSVKTAKSWHPRSQMYRAVVRAAVASCCGICPLRSGSNCSAPVVGWRAWPLAQLRTTSSHPGTGMAQSFSGISFLVGR
jgi:hypothetical protein